MNSESKENRTKQDEINSDYSFVQMEVPAYITPVNKETYREWLDILINSVFNVFGNDIIVISFVTNQQQICLKTVTEIDHSMLLNAAKNFQQSLIKTGKLSRTEVYEFYFNGIRMDDMNLSFSQNKSLVNIIISLSYLSTEIGFLAIYTPYSAKEFQSHHASLLQVPTEITTALKYLFHITDAQQHRQNAILNAMLDGVLLLNKSGDVLFANKIAYKLLGLNDKVSIQTPNLRQAEHLDITNFLLEALEDQYDALNKIRKIKALNKIIGIHIQKLKDFNNQPLGWMVLLRDVTADWEMDRLRKEFIAKITHELHSPLTVVTEGVALVLEEKAGAINPDQRRCLNYARENLERMERLIDNLLRITRLEISSEEIDRRKKVSLNYVLKNVLESYQNRFHEKQIQFKRVIPEKEIQISANRDRITQLFVNLLDNALKYTKKTGMIEVGIQANKTYVTGWVKDSGIGIAKKYQHRIFDKMFRIKNKANQSISGHGFGLAIVKEIVESYDGQIWVESEVNKGSRFVFRLPLFLEESK